MFSRNQPSKRNRRKVRPAAASTLGCESLETRLALATVVGFPVLPASPVVAVSASQATTGTFGNFTYSATATDVTITDCDTAVTSAVIPRSINGIPVTGIAVNGFAGCANLKSVEIPDTVTSIGSYAFYSCTSLLTIAIPNGVTSIGEATFKNCPKLESATLGAGLTHIGKSAFESCNSLKSIAVPDGVESIGDRAFRHSSSLSEIRLGSGLKSIGESAFWGCAIKSLSVPDNVVSIGESAFLFCFSLEQVSLGRSLATIGQNAFAGCGKITTITIPRSVTGIGYTPFQNCSSLTSIFFLGSPPTLDGDIGSNAIARFPAGNAAWSPYAGSQFGGLPAKPMTRSTAPGLPVAIAGNGRADVSWTAPSYNGGNPVTDYVIESSRDGGATWAVFNDGVSAATTTTVTGLTNGVGYVFRVTAVNLMGVSDRSATSAAVVPASAPVAPTNVVGAAGRAQVVLNWAAPASNGGAAIKDYMIQCSSDAGANWTPVNDGVSAATAATVTGLMNGTTYVFRVAAVNAAGAGAYSLLSAGVTPRTVPSIVTGVSTAAADKSVKVSWVAPVSNGGSTINGYRIAYAQRVGQAWAPWVNVDQPASAGTQAVIGGLANGSAYVFHVSAVNAAGYGPASATGVLATPMTVASVPTAVIGTPGSGQVSVVWTAPASNGGAAIIDYVVQVSMNNGIAWTTFNDGVSTAPRATVTGLTNGQAYQFRVLAVNAAGTSAASQSSAQVTPKTQATGAAVRAAGVVTAQQPVSSQVFSVLTAKPSRKSRQS